MASILTKKRNPAGACLRRVFHFAEPARHHLYPPPSVVSAICVLIGYLSLQPPRDCAVAYVADA